MSAQLNGEQQDALGAFFEARRNAGLWTKEQKARKAKLDELYPDASKAETDVVLASSDGEFIGKVRIVPSKRLDVDRLKAERPEIYAEYVTESTQTRIEEPK